MDVPEFTYIPPVSREARRLLERYQALVMAGNDRQNLVARSTVSTFWARHIEDSLQLVPLLTGAVFVDVGSGAGLPGLVVACACDATVHLIEPRRQRADFLSGVVIELGLTGRVHVHQDRIEAVRIPDVTVMMARAVAKASELFQAAANVTSDRTRWVLPKGRSAASDLEDARLTWQGDFALVQSATDPDAAIIVAERVMRRP